MFRDTQGINEEDLAMLSDAISLEDGPGIMGAIQDFGSPPDAEEPDRFVGVERNTDEEDHPGLSPNSKPTPLLRQIRASSLHFGEFTTSIGQVRQEILSKLPTGTISSKRNPDSHCATFRLRRRSLELRIRYECQIYKSSRQRPLSDFVVLTSSSVEQTQATTVKEYVQQTWGSRGATILEAIQCVFDSPAGHSCQGQF